MIFCILVDWKDSNMSTIAGTRWIPQIQTYHFLGLHWKSRRKAHQHTHQRRRTIFAVFMAKLTLSSETMAIRVSLSVIMKNVVATERSSPAENSGSDSNFNQEV